MRSLAFIIGDCLRMTVCLVKHEKNVNTSWTHIHAHTHTIYRVLLYSKYYGGGGVVYVEAAQLSAAAVAASSGRR